MQHLITVTTKTGDASLIVANWDELKDGDVTTLLGSSMFAMASGVGLLEGDRPEDFFAWRDADEDERAAWTDALKQWLADNGETEPPPIFLHHLGPTAH